MITFNVVKEEYGWAIRIGERMTTPFRSRDLAIREAKCLADAIRCHGECTEVIVEGANPNDPPNRLEEGERASAELEPAGTLAGTE